MPAENLVFIIAIVFAFASFAFVLAWAERRTASRKSFASTEGLK